MSFTQKVKIEILSNNIKKKCCKQAFLSGLLHSAGSLNFKRGGIDFSISSESNKLIEKAFDYIKELYNLECQVLTGTSSALNKGALYTLNAHSYVAKNILIQTGIIFYDADGLININYNILDDILKKDCCIKNFVSGLFLGCGIVNIPDTLSKAKSYHLEFSFFNNQMADNLIELLNKYEFSPKKVVRKNNYVVYLKESEQISNLLIFLGASSQALYLQSVMVDRQMNNDINRQTNCISANIDKMVIASANQVEAIRLIEKTIGFDSLDEKLREIAKIRLEHIDESIEELSQYMTVPIGKSGINHRLRKLILIANDIKGGNTNGKQGNYR